MPLQHWSYTCQKKEDLPPVKHRRKIRIGLAGHLRGPERGIHSLLRQGVPLEPAISAHDLSRSIDLLSEAVCVVTNVPRADGEWEPGSFGTASLDGSARW